MFLRPWGRWLPFPYESEELSQNFYPLCYGLGALWLLAPWIGGRSRIVAFPRILLVCGIFGFCSLALRHEWDLGQAAAVEALNSLALAVCVCGVGLSLAGWTCRRRCKLVLLCSVLMLWLCAGWMLGLGVWAWIQGKSVALGILAAVSVAVHVFLMALPFLVLSFGSPFHGQRLRTLLCLPESVPGLVPPGTAPAK